eukprot:TRINITY_DN2215_c0_g1_i1.p1 TRINITY_DN2215_c0_g1~~TRINITY_DN2215_c0_g1_i1.p1  ORF type:complete len:223 (+),score=33.90 TRINITY_DN2215_c0_g1_i1:487-1155(+)
MAPPIRAADVTVPNRPLPAVPAGSAKHRLPSSSSAHPQSPGGAAAASSSTALQAPPRVEQSTMAGSAARALPSHTAIVRVAVTSSAPTYCSPHSVADVNNGRGGGTAARPPLPRRTSEPLLPPIRPTLASSSTDTRSLEELVTASEARPEHDAGTSTAAAVRPRRCTEGEPGGGSNAVAAAEAQAEAVAKWRAAAATRNLADLMVGHANLVTAGGGRASATT